MIRYYKGRIVPYIKSVKQTGIELKYPLQTLDPFKETPKT